jgi:hypothetical protein
VDTQLKKAFEETLEARIISTVPDMPDHRFSLQFERKMKRLAGGGAPKKLTVRRLFVCVTAAIIAAALAASSVSAVRDFFKRFFTETFSTHTAVQSADTAEAPETIEVVYTIDVPEGFETEDAFMSDIFCNTTYVNNNKHIYFSQNVKSAFDVNVNTEDHTMEYVEINGCDGFIVDIGIDEAYILWDNGEYVFEMLGNIGKSELISVAETVQKAEQ